MLLLILRALALSITEQSQEWKSFILLLADDLQADAIGIMGRLPVRTPAIDRLAEQGVVFDRAYCMGSMVGTVCAPSRGSIFTGRPLSKLPDKAWSLDQVQAPVLWPEVLRTQFNYQTFHTGKWHSGHDAFLRSFSDGKSVFIGGMGNHSNLLVMDRKGNKFARQSPLQVFASIAFTDAALQFLDRRDRSRPFFLSIGFTVPHDEATDPQGYPRPRTPEVRLYDSANISLPANFLPEHPFDIGTHEERDELLAPTPRPRAMMREQLADYYSLITSMDAQVGRLLDRLDKSNLMPTTFIVFSADHGLAMGRHGLLGKQNLYEHSMRVPMIVAGPGVAANLRVQTLVYVADLFPTLLDLGGLVDSNSSSGSLNATLAASPFKSLRPCMLPVHATAKPHACASPHHVIVTAFATLARAITTQRWKLICYPPSARVQLFDLRKDPLEMHDLGADAEHAPLRVSLLLELVRTFRGMVPPVPNPRASHVNCSHQTASHLCLYPVERMNFPTHFARLNDTIMCPLHHTLTGESWREYYGGSAQYVQYDHEAVREIQ